MRSATDFIASSVAFLLFASIVLRFFGFKDLGWPLSVMLGTLAAVVGMEILPFLSVFPQRGNER